MVPPQRLEQVERLPILTVGPMANSRIRLRALCAGVYTVTITDNNGCFTSSSITITEPSLVSAAATSTDASCNNGADGTATALGAGGTGAYSYTWSTTPTQNTATATNLAQGIYTVTVEDNNNCAATASVTISEPSAITATVATTPALCNGAADGIARATVLGGTPGVPAYTYNWGNGLTAIDTHAVAAGNYTVTIADGNGCTVTANYTITEPSPIVLTGSTTPASCNGTADGTASVNASGAIGGFTYVWTDGQITTTATGLLAGVHCVTVTDANGCTTDTCLTVTEPAGFTTPVFHDNSRALRRWSRWNG